MTERYAQERVETIVRRRDFPTSKKYRPEPERASTGIVEAHTTDSLARMGLLALLVVNALIMYGECDVRNKTQNFEQRVDQNQNFLYDRTGMEDGRITLLEEKVRQIRR